MSERVENLNSKTLYQTLWNAADILRSKMDANEYKDYLLGLIFYKYLSDKMLYYVSEQLETPTHDLVEAQKYYEEVMADEDYREDVLYDVQDHFSYTIKPEKTFTKLMQDINLGKFELESLVSGFREIEASSEVFENMFEDIDLYSSRLGRNDHQKNKVISDVMKELSTLNLSGHAGDVLGDAYEYLIGQFASESGKKAGEFYTPQPVSELMTRIAMLGKEDQEGFTVYDPTMGSGSLMLNAKKYSNHPGKISYFGQELNTSTYNLARMNMILHGVPIGQQHLHNADTLDADWPTEEPTNFDAVLMNPPYSAKWSSDKGFLLDNRFSRYEKLAPKSRADFAFLLHGFYHLKDTGIMAIVLPHGVLFRGAAELAIRKTLLEDGSIDAVIGLPANLFFNTSIPTTVIVLKKNRTNRDVMFIDASQEFEKRKNQNHLTEENIEKILETYLKREFVDKYAYCASYEEIVENDYNLNIPRYVDTFEEEEPIDILELSKEMQQINKEIAEAEKEFLAMLDELQVTDESREIIQATKEMFQR